MIEASSKWTFKMVDEVKVEAEETQIDLMGIIRALVKKWWLILILAVIGGGAMFAKSYFFTPTYYSASVTMYANSSSGVSIGSYNLSVSDVSLSRTLVDTYAVIVVNQETLEDVAEKATTVKKNEDGSLTTISLIDKYGYNRYPVKYMDKSVSVAAINKTEFFSITVEAYEPEDAMALANAFIKVLPEIVSDVIHGASAEPLHYATTYTVLSAHVGRNTVIGMLVGIALAMAIIVVFDLFINDTVDNVEWVKTRFGDSIPLLAVVPNTSEHQTRGRGYYKKGYYRSHYYDSKSKQKGDKE